MKFQTKRQTFVFKMTSMIFFLQNLTRPKWVMRSRQGSRESSSRND